jgi:hypothetical protein
LKANFPECEPYILTHGDLNLSNIIVKDDKIQAIIDWEVAGYMPWWAERWLSLLHGDPSTGSDELMNPIWAKIDAEVNEETFQKYIIDTIAPVTQAWTMAVREHDGFHDRWLRPPFCECQPYGGWFKNDKIGKPWVHRVETEEEFEAAENQRAINEADPYSDTPWLDPELAHLFGNMGMGPTPK